MFFSRKDSFLFPYVKEDIYSNFADRQEIPWSIAQYNIPRLWGKYTGRNVVVAVIDSGCELDHPDLRRNYIEGYNTIDKNKDPLDENGHGTHVAGTVAAVNNSQGVVGVAPDAKIMPIKVFDRSGSGSTSNVARAVEWAGKNGADIICMSLGSKNGSRHLEKAIIGALNRGAVCFCAAGNSGEKTDILYPAKFELTVSTGAIDINQNRTLFSCSGEELDFLAPGADILSTMMNGRYAVMSGTSMANPYVVGCAALLCEWAKKHRIKLTTANDYIEYLKKYTTPLKNVKYKNNKSYEGHGILDPRKFNF